MFSNPNDFNTEAQSSQKLKLQDLRRGWATFLAPPWRGLVLPVSRIEAVIPTAEDVVIQKLRWQREKDIADVRTVMSIQAERLDWTYIHRWTDQHGTSELLERLRKELGV